MSHIHSVFHSLSIESFMKKYVCYDPFHCIAKIFLISSTILLNYDSKEFSLVYFTML